MTATTFAAVFAALYAAHSFGDHWVQTHGQACGKGAPGWPGRRACAAHVATLTGTKAVALAALWLVTGLHLHPAAGAYALDQSWHHGWLFVAALIIAGGS